MNEAIFAARSEALGLVAADGMATGHEWALLTHGRKTSWLASLTDLQVRAQASVASADTRTPVRDVLLLWVASGYLSYERALAALAATVEALPFDAAEAA
jgi:hypothetical protein